MQTKSATVPFSERLAYSADIPNDRRPLLTIGIPHYKHRRYLEQVLDSVFAQTFGDFEILVSDDASPDDSQQFLPGLLSGSKRSFRYYVQRQNLGYDGNVRFCLGAAVGCYVFLLGNDDALAGPTTLADIAHALEDLSMPSVAFTNFADWQTGTVTRRAQATSILGRGPDTASRYFRSFSFVSGILFDREQAHLHETDRWDRSIYYQIYLASRIVAAGGTMGAIDVCAVRKDIRVNGETVPNYASKWAGAPWSLESRHTGLDSVIRVTADAILPQVPPGTQSATLRRIISPILTITYPSWMFEYRRVANWSFAVGVARGLWPSALFAEYSLQAFDRLYLWSLYIAVTVGGLIIPAGLFNRFRGELADWARRRQQAAAKAD